MPQTYSETEKQEAVKLYQTVGTAEASRRVGASATSIKRWAAEYGVTDQTKREKTEAAREQLAVQRALDREELRTLLLEKSILLTKAIEPAKGVRDIATAVGILIDKFRLEMGEATSRAYHEGSDDIDRRVSQLVAEMGTRSETEAS